VSNDGPNPSYLQPYLQAASRHGATFGALLWASPKSQAARFHALVLGLRTSSSIAHYLGFYLDIMLNNVKVLNTSGTTSLYEELIRIKESDVLIVISYPRYSKNTIEATKYVKERNAKIIAITDTEASPIYSLADVSLLAMSNMVSFVDSLVVPLCMVNNLIVNISLQEKEEIKEYYDRLERLWDNHSIYQ
jgi:DNA-binding MurR/RpiR family transcriptional regulator